MKDDVQPAVYRPRLFSRGRTARLWARICALLDGSLARRIDVAEQTLRNAPTNLEALARVGKPSPLEPNSYYVDRWPSSAADFDGWTPATLQRLHDVTRDRDLHRLYDNAMGFISGSWNDKNADYYEFGICGAGTFRLALAKAKKWHLAQMRFWAFDSFKGFPHDGALAMSEKDFWASIRSQGVNTEKVETVPGFYDASLTDDLQRQFIARGRPAAFINIDCDLHESADRCSGSSRR